MDVRGWAFTPHRGQNTRKQRLAIGVARQLAGISAPPPTKSTESLSSSQAPSRTSSPSRPTRQEEDLIAFEAETIVKRGEAEERAAQRGEYSEDPSKGADVDSLYATDSRSSSPERGSRLSRFTTVSSVVEDQNDPMITPLQKRTSWAQPSKMTAAELTIANGHLLARLKPFMHNPLADTAISAFFYNESASRQHTVHTNEYGHFAFHVSLDFIPTHVRVLAGERLSMTEEVIITTPEGVSLISDIDDTVKHSAISAGYSEIFRNAFIRDLGDLTIDGVREWYNTLHDMGVKMHYVSNSPWQMYPIITSYFKTAQLPRGSFHLKQYTGMLNGIFEPVAERKKSSLDKILHDFPNRKFMLVGDSGEADLEVYTETALANPNRILGIFIRDVTTPTKTGYFDSSMGPSGSAGHSRNHSRNHSRHRSGDSLTMSKRLSRPGDIRYDDADLEAAVAASLADMEKDTRQARRSINPDAYNAERFDGAGDWRGKSGLSRRSTKEDSISLSPEDDLIDFSEDTTPSKPWLASLPDRNTLSATLASSASAVSRHLPSRPPKPAALQSPPSGIHTSPVNDSTLKQPPPRPRKPSTTVKPLAVQSLQLDGPSTPASQPSPTQPLPPLQTHAPSPLSQESRQDSPLPSKEKPPLPVRPRMHHKLATAASAYWGGTGATTSSRPTSIYDSHETPRPMSTSSTRSMDDLRAETRSRKTAPPPPPPPRRNASSYSFAGSSRKAANRHSGGGWDPDHNSPLGSPDEMSTKERLWRQRWARAQSLLEPKGVTLRTWRVGSDVADIAVKLAEMEFRRIEREKRDRAR